MSEHKARAIERLWWARGTASGAPTGIPADAPESSALPAAAEARVSAAMRLLDRALLRPLSTLYGAAIGMRRRWHRRRNAPARSPVPVVVVGNVVVGGAGKTPTVIAVVKALQDRGWTPGVVSRGYGASGRSRKAAPMEVGAQTPVALSGDEPQLIRRRTGVPVWVGRRRLAAVRALCSAHPAVDIVVADDGLQHLDLPRDVEIVVFDERGAGNGRLLPAGPLREGAGAGAVPSHGGQRPSQNNDNSARDARSGPPSGFAPEGSFAIARAIAYNAPAPSTPQPGYVLGRRLLGGWTLADWREGWHEPRPLMELAALARTAPTGAGAARAASAPLRAAAGIGAPEKFFSMLRREGLNFEPWPLPDHADLRRLPWPDDGRWTFVTEKDAVKIAPDARGAERIVVVALDLSLPAAMQRWLEQSLPSPGGRRQRASLGR